MVQAGKGAWALPNKQLGKVSKSASHSLGSLLYQGAERFYYAASIPPF